jgi:hypothetical protein
MWGVQADEKLSHLGICQAKDSGGFMFFPQGTASKLDTSGCLEELTIPVRTDDPRPSPLELEPKQALVDLPTHEYDVGLVTFCSDPTLPSSRYWTSIERQIQLPASCDILSNPLEVDIRPNDECQLKGISDLTGPFSWKAWRDKERLVFDHCLVVLDCKEATVAKVTDHSDRESKVLYERGTDVPRRHPVVVVKRDADIRLELPKGTHYQFELPQDKLVIVLEWTGSTVNRGEKYLKCVPAASAAASGQTG